MKNKNLKICFTVILSLALYSLKAQSIQQKFQKDMDQRNKHVSAVRLKAKEQEAQQKAERTQISIPQNTNNTVSPNMQTVPVQPGNNEVKPQAQPVIKKAANKQQLPAKPTQY